MSGATTVSQDPLTAELESDETLRYETSLRDGGRVGVTDRRLLVLRDEGISVPFPAISEVTFQVFDWFLGVVSVLLAGIGVIYAATDPVVGFIFVVAGTVSLVITYRKRYRAQIRITGRRETVSLRLEDLDAFRDALETSLDEFDLQEEDQS